MQLHILSGGAAQGLVTGVAERFERDTGHTISGRFGAVGAMLELLRAGAPADVLILTRALIDTLTAEGVVDAASRTDLGRVRTAIAVRSGDPCPPVGDRAALSAALASADAIYVPDPERATAGIHFAKVMAALGVLPQASGRLRSFPNGTAAMAALARAGEARPIGCTQVTEIRNTAGVDLVAPLPSEFELATLYTAAICAHARGATAPNRLLALLGGDDTRALRARVGFE